ncbi:MAG: aminotransferase class III-fold pyridoxal phosphate-dependent enzyme [Bdellovibrionales bacterium]
MRKTKGQAIRESDKIENMLNNLVNEVQSESSRIEGLQNQDVQLAEQAKDLMSQIGTVRGRPLYFPYVGTGAGRGAYVELEDGSVKLDLINGIGINVLGHSHPQVIKAALRGALSDVVMQGNLEPNLEYFKISKKLLDIASRNSKLKHVWLSTCGTMANENALKACRQKKTPARKIIAMQSAFAGRSTMMAEVTDNPAFKVGLPEYNEVLRVPWFNKKDPQSAEKSLAILKEHVAKNESNICCFTFEPVQGEGGFNVAPREFFLPLLKFCKEKQIPIWLDEVQTFTRTGQFFAFETLGIGEYVDVCTVAKTVQNGATFYTEEFNPKPGLIAGTFSGSSVSLSAGLEILNILDSGEYMGPKGIVTKIHSEFVGMLNLLNTTTCRGLLNDAGGLGLMCAVTPHDGSKDKVEKLVHTLFKNGLICFTCGRDPYRLRFLLPAILKSEDIAVAKNVIEKSVLETV